MTIFRSINDIVISFIDYLRMVQPELDTKPGTVARDLFIDAPSQQIAELYSQLRNISNLQSLFSTSGTDLSRLASNFGVTRKTGNNATGIAVFTTNTLDSDILIPSGSVVIASNGISFQVVNSFMLSLASSNVYKATATRLRDELNLASITDIYAAEVNVESLTSGVSGNVGPYSLITHSISGISNVTNLQSFSGGSNPESDDSFRTRILSIFAGSNTGTSLGYSTSVKATTGVQDAVVIVPGDPLLTRDGTQVTTDSDGNLIVSESGSGGKVDIYVLGSNLISQIDSFIYNDQSGRNDPTDSSNDIILGQKGQSTSINSSQRRVELISENNLPFQPVNNIVSVVGSSSGSNFSEKFTDSQGEVHGNYELVKDTGDFGGSPFGFDKMRWVSNTIEIDDEEVIKGTFNGADQLNFSDVEEIRSIFQDMLVVNENSSVNTSSRNTVSLLHTPIRSVSRIVNLTTGERYVVEDQNPNGVSGELNTTGNITISGNTLPTNTDILQVDYIWVKQFDSDADFDNLRSLNINRTVQDSIDWGFGNLINNEPAEVTDDGYGNLTVQVAHPIYKVISVHTFTSEGSSISDGMVSVNEVVNSVIDIKRTSDNAEVFNTDARDGILSGTINIILPSDTIGSDGDLVIVRFNSNDIFSADGYDTGTFSDNIISIPSGLAAGGDSVLVSYVSNVSTLLPENNISSLPATKRGNSFVIANTETGEQPTSDKLDVNDNIIANLRRASSNLRVNIRSTITDGNIVILGTTMHKVENALVVVTSGSGFEADLGSAILADAGLQSIPSNISVVKICSVERVNISSSGNVSSVGNTYDIINYKLKNNSYDLDKALEISSLSNTKFILPGTPKNTDAMLSTGDILRVTFYYIKTNDTETLYFSKNGEQITDKIFSTVDRIYTNFGFKDTSGNFFGTIVVNNYNQPSDNTTYSVSYDYVAPKENERITITYNHNSVINDATLSIEDVRPITADVLVKAANAKSIDVSVKIVILPEFVSQAQTVIQDTTDAIITLLSAKGLGTTIDSSDVVNALYSVQGIDRVRIINFSYGSSGNVLSIAAQKNEYLTAGVVTVESEER